MLYYTILYHFALYYIILYRILLCYIILYSIVLYYIILYFTTGSLWSCVVFWSPSLASSFWDFPRQRYAGGSDLEGHLPRLLMELSDLVSETSPGWNRILWFQWQTEHAATGSIFSFCKGLDLLKQLAVGREYGRDNGGASTKNGSTSVVQIRGPSSVRIPLHSTTTFCLLTSLEYKLACMGSRCCPAATKAGLQSRGLI